jgi:uncharacterized repeat protein (TIGR01451 family)
MAVSRTNARSLCGVVKVQTAFIAVYFTFCLVHFASFRITTVTLAKVVDKATAFPGDTLAYTITYTNTGTEPISSFVIHDRTPSYTVFVSATYASLPDNLTACAITAPAIGGTGSITWEFTGALQPGSEGTVSYSVNVE